jgi:hypothetical protein
MNDQQREGHLDPDAIAVRGLVHACYRLLRSSAKAVCLV